MIRLISQEYGIESDSSYELKDIPYESTTLIIRTDTGYNNIKDYDILATLNVNSFIMGTYSSLKYAQFEIDRLHNWARSLDPAKMDVCNIFQFANEEDVKKAIEELDNETINNWE